MPKVSSTRRSAAPSPTSSLQKSRGLTGTSKPAPQLDPIPELPAPVLNSMPRQPALSRSPPASRSFGRRLTSRLTRAAAEPSAVANQTASSNHADGGSLNGGDVGSNVASGGPTPYRVNTPTEPASVAGNDGGNKILRWNGRTFLDPPVKEESVEPMPMIFEVFPPPFAYTYPYQPPLDPDPESSENLLKMKEQVDFVTARTEARYDETETMVNNAASTGHVAAMETLKEIKRLDKFVADIRESCDQKELFDVYYRLQVARVIAALKAGEDPYSGVWHGDTVGSECGSGEEEEEAEVEETEEDVGLGKRPREEHEEAGEEERPKKRLRTRSIYSRTLAHLRSQVPPHEPKESPAPEVMTKETAEEANAREEAIFGFSEAVPSEASASLSVAYSPKLIPTSKGKGKGKAKEEEPEHPKHGPILRRPILFGPERQFVYVRPILYKPKDPQDIEPAAGSALAEDTRLAHAGTRAAPSGQADSDSLKAYSESPAANDVRDAYDDELEYYDPPAPPSPPGLLSSDVRPQQDDWNDGPAGDDMTREPVDEDVFGRMLSNPVPRRSSFPSRLTGPFGRPRNDSQYDDGPSFGASYGYHNALPAEAPSAYIRRPLDRMSSGEEYPLSPREGPSASFRRPQSGMSSAQPPASFRRPLNRTLSRHVPPSLETRPSDSLSRSQVRSTRASRALADALQGEFHASRPSDMQNTDSEDDGTDEDISRPISPLMRPGTPRPARHPWEEGEDPCPWMRPPRSIPEVLLSGTEEEVARLRRQGISRGLETEQLYIEPL
ncbi:uncharacterized protein B0H18DRAFT_282158 [Fomitopsis serialis]|uniref:uncharacterized protein n=1 Tax=Fomitopsis serialis TaxID=139415 RepID=UPI0020080222|nr:uncharacterized protein B0H18DRAFT_282158 [Neoantrodia serialis]KAH9927637.1 hypothetical protein B0H18DRAFT_282158 [Neoantrodia serialis]